MGQPGFNAAGLLAGRKVPGHTDRVGGGANNHRAALHQELVHGKELPLREVLGGEHHQDVRFLRGATGGEVGSGDGVLFLHQLLQHGELRSLLGRHHAVLRHGRLRGAQRNGFGKAGAEPFESRLDGPFQPVPAEIFRQGNFHHLVAGGKGHVEPEGAGIKDGEGHGPKSILLCQFSCHAAVSVVRIDGGGAELLAAFLVEFGGDRLNIALYTNQFLGKDIVWGEIAGKSDRLVDGRKEITAALIGKEHLFD